MSRKQLSAAPARDGTADDTGCTILHVDMDAFYASVEVRERPELRGRAVIVGGGARGVVLSATYDVRAHGVHSAMPMVRARRLCPAAVVVAPDFASYRAASAGVMAVFRAVTPLVEPIGLDEAFLDVTGSARRLGRPSQIAALIRAQIADDQGITCSVGTASTKFVAKLASACCKPDGLLVVPRDGVVEFLHPLPVGALWGVGERAEELLRAMGLRTVGDLARAPVATLRRVLGNAVGTHLAALAWGRDERPVVADSREKSIGAEETFDVDIANPVEIRRELLRLSERTASRLRAAGLVGRTVSIKLRFADFSTLTRSRTVAEPTDVAHTVYATARELYDTLEINRGALRLVGVRVEGLHGADDAARQLRFDEPVSGWREVEQAAERAARRYGTDAVRPASLLDAVPAIVPVTTDRDSG